MICPGPSPEISSESKNTAGRRFSRPFFEGVVTVSLPSIALLRGGIYSRKLSPSLTMSIAREPTIGTCRITRILRGFSIRM